MTSVVDMHRCHMKTKFGVFVDEDHSRFPTLYWLPNFINDLIANSSYNYGVVFTFDFLPYCHLKPMLSNIVQQFMEVMVKIILDY